MKTDIDKFLSTGYRMICLLILFAFIISENNLLSLNIIQKPTRQSSLEAFSKGDYELAYREFSELLSVYPRDPLYNYYCGVCLVKLTRDPVRAVAFLKQALQGTAVVRAIPSDAHFWLGRAQQMSGFFSDAIASFTSYTYQAGKKAARDLGVQEYIQQCNNRKGQLEDLIIEPAVASGKTKQNSITNANNAGSDNGARLKDPVVQSGKEPLPLSYDIILTEALKYQRKADSVLKVTDVKKKNLEKAGYKQKPELKAEITRAENLATEFQKKADEKYAEAQFAMNSDTSTTIGKIAGKNALNINIPIEPASDSATKSPEVKPVPESASTATGTNTKDSKETISINNKKKQEVKEPLRQTVPIEKIKTELQPQGILSLFEVKTKPEKSPGAKVPVNPAVPQGLIYRIQLAVFRNPVVPSYFKGIAPVFGFKVAGTDKTNYYAGMFRRLKDANKALLVVKQKGFKDAFVVAQSGGKPVSSERAAILEKEWGNKPFIAPGSGIRQLPADTIPPALSFRVECSRSQKPLKEEVIEGMKKIAGGRGFEIETLDKGTSVYLIGRFITFESAEEYAGLLKRNGYRDAKVVARLGKKEIPVETAIELFDKIE